MDIHGILWWLNGGGILFDFMVMTRDLTNSTSEKINGHLPSSNLR